jgi:MFS family permease
MTRFYLSCLLAFTGGHMINYAVILYLQDKVGSDLLSGVGFGLSFGTSIVFGWFTGVLCDRVSPTRVIHAAQLLFVLCLAGLWRVDAGVEPHLRVTLILLCAFLGGLAWSFVGPARLAALGQLVPRENLKPATIVFNLQVLLGFGLAPVVIGITRHLSGWPAVFASGMACFVASSVLLLGTSTRRQAVSGQSVWEDMSEGFRAVRANALLSQLILVAIIAYAMTGPMQIMLPKLAHEVLGLGEVSRGVYLGLMALALIGGGISALFLGKHVPHGKAIFLGILVATLLFASLGWWTDPAASAVVLACMGLLGGMVISFVVAGIQGQAPESMRGRIMGMYSIISQVIPAASGVAAGALIRSYGVGRAIVIAGLALCAVAALATSAMTRLRKQA